MKAIHLLVLAFISLAFGGTAQEAAIDFKQIDLLFEGHNSGTPGYALGIIKDGKLIYSKGYGSANLDYHIPLSDTSVFYIGSMAKQFTTAGLLVLEAQGKIDFTKEVRHYLSDFPTYDYPITVSHLIHHISGIRETNSMQLFQGIDTKFEEVFDTDDLYQLVIQQESLNFPPGTEYRYSSGGYAVLAKIIEQISGQSLRQFLEEHLFHPLEMHHTFVCDNHNEVIKNRVVSYWPIDKNQWERRNLVFDAYGDGGIVTTVQDLAKWDQAFYKDLLGIKGFAQKMYTKGKLNSGEEIDYARALHVVDYKGHQMITHNGGMLGFRVDLVRFPEQQLSIIALANSAYSNPTRKILEIADLILPSNKAKAQQRQPVQTKKSALDLKALTGYYWTDEANYFRHISMSNDSLFFDSGNPEYKNYLIPIGNHQFELSNFDPKTILSFFPNSTSEELQITFGSLRRSFRKYDATPPESVKELAPYVGTYFSKELHTSYRFFIKEDHFWLQINQNAPMQLFPSRGRTVWNSKRMVWIGFGELKFHQTKAGKVLGLTIGDQRVSGIYFGKVTP